LDIEYRPVELGTPQPLLDWSRTAYRVFTSAEKLAAVYGTECGPVDVDWDQEFLVVVQRGECPTGGYGVSIQGLALETPGRLAVRVATRDPGPDDFVTMMVTFPRAAVAVSRQGLERVRDVVFTDLSGRVLEIVGVQP